MTKSLAEQMREDMQRIEAVAKPAQPPRPDFTWTVDNPDQPAPGTDPDDWNPEIDVGVTYSLHGRYYAATREQPAEYPEIEISVFNLETGEDITDKLSPSDLESIEQRAWEHSDEHGAAEPDDPRDEYDPDDRYDDPY